MFPVLGVASLVVVLLAWLCYRLGSEAREHDPGVSAVLGGIFLLIALWVPGGARDVVLAVVLALLTWLGSGSFLGGAALGGILYGGGRLVPGGTNAVVVGLFLLFLVVEVLDLLSRQRRLRGAARLEPGAPSSGLVEISGRVVVEKPLLSPLGHPCAAWWAMIGDERRSSDNQIELRNGDGSAWVHVPIDPDLTGHRQDIPNEDLPRLASSLGVEKLTANATGHERWIELDSEVTVVGEPTWTSAIENGRGYRDSPLAPVFKATETSSVLFFDRSSERARYDNQLRMAQWGLWALSAGGVLALQLTKLTW